MGEREKKVSHNFLMGYESVIYVTCLTIDMHYLCVSGQLGFWLGGSVDLGWACSCVLRVSWLLAILSGLG